jgi:hypothetical protein
MTNFSMRLAPLVALAASLWVLHFQNTVIHDLVRANDHLLVVIDTEEADIKGANVQLLADAGYFKKLKQTTELRNGQMMEDKRVLEQYRTVLARSQKNTNDALNLVVAGKSREAALVALVGLCAGSPGTAVPTLQGVVPDPVFASSYSPR